jgi:hypothetical protein
MYTCIIIDKFKINDNLLILLSIYQRDNNDI